MGPALKPEQNSWSFRPSPDFCALLDALPGAQAVLLPDAPRFTIAAVNDEYLRRTNLDRASVSGRRLSEVLPSGTYTAELDESLHRALTSGALERLKVTAYFATDPAGGNGSQRGWTIRNTAVLCDGQTQYILHS